jgi:tetratricopeptide (TPR) repeat protein
LAQGDAWAALGEPDKAGDWFRRAIAKSLPASTEQLEAYYGLLTTFDGRLNTRDEQIATCLKALETFPLDAQLLCAMGSYLQAQGRLDLACRSYQMAVEHGQINLHTWHLARLAEFAVVCYSLTLDLQGRSVEACQVLRNALSSSTGSERLRRHLIELHIKHNQRRDALAEADQLPLEVLHREPLRNAIRGACLAVQQQWSSATAYLRGAYDAGCRDPICLRWLTSGFMAAGNFDAAEPILHQWQTVAPENPEPARWLLTLAAGRRAAKTDRSATSKADAPSRWIDTTTVGAAPHIGISPMPTDSGLFAR